MAERPRAGDGQEVTRDDTEVVLAVRSALADKVGKSRYDLWFGSGTQIHLDGASLTVTVPSPFFKEWIRANFRREIETACEEVTGARPSVAFRVDSTSGDGCRRSEPANGSHALSGGDGHQRSAPGSNGADTRPAKPARRRFADFATFVVGDSNRLARTSAELAAKRPGELSPLLLHGPTGVGKTHLLEAMWVLGRRSGQRRSAVFLSAEQFTTYFLEALRGSGMPSFRRKYRGVDLLIVDDLQFFSGKRATQIELLYTIDTLMREGRQLAFAADRPPNELRDLGGDLITRLESGMVCRIDPPEYETRVGIVAQMAGRVGLRLPEEVQRFIAAQFRSHARALSGAVCRLQAASRASSRPITLELARETLADMIRSTDRVVRLADIQKAVCDVFHVELASLVGAGKSRGVSYPRMLAMWLARKHTRAALSEIGQFFGRRSHSTVISAQKRVEQWLAEGQTIEVADRAWSLGDTIKRIEHELRAG